MGEALFLTLWDKAATILSRRLNSKHQRSEEHTSELQSQSNLVCRLLLEKKKNYRHTCRDGLFFVTATKTTSRFYIKPSTFSITFLLSHKPTGFTTTATTLFTVAVYTAKC